MTAEQRERAIYMTSGSDGFCSECRTRRVTEKAAALGLDMCWLCLEAYQAAERPQCVGFNRTCTNPSDKRSEGGDLCAVCEYQMWLASDPEDFLGTFGQFKAHVEKWRERAGIEIDLPASSPLYAKQERIIPPARQQPLHLITAPQFAGMYAIGLIVFALMFIRF